MPSKRKEPSTGHRVTDKRQNRDRRLPCPVERQPPGHGPLEWDSTFCSGDVSLDKGGLQLTKQEGGWDLVKATHVISTKDTGTFYYEMEIVNDPCVYLGLVAADVDDNKSCCLGGTDGFFVHANSGSLYGNCGHVTMMGNDEQ